VKIKVALFGMDKRCEDRMLTVFKMNFKNLCEQTSIENADTVIVDLDDKKVDKAWAEFRSKYPHIPAIIMATKPIETADSIYISKPAKLKELLAALKKSSNIEVDTEAGLTSQSNTHKVASALQDRTISSRKVNQTPDNYDFYYYPEKFLQGKVINAIQTSNEHDQNIFIKCWSDRWILILPNSNYLFQNIKESQLRNLGLVQADDEISFSEKIFSDKEMESLSESPTNQVQLTPVEKFIWDVTVRTARGRVPDGTSLDDLYVLQHWPNLTRLSHIPNASRISAFWLDQPQSINHIVEKLGIPFQDVLTYFSAASATGALKIAKRNEDNLIKPEVIQVENKKRGIFASLMRKVSKNIVRNESAEV
jgi:hypothetical protein